LIVGAGKTLASGFTTAGAGVLNVAAGATITAPATLGHTGGTST
jgi:hypothetical protein